MQYVVGSHNLKKLELRNLNGDKFDVKGLLVTFELFEDIFSNTLSATLTLIDSIGLVENFPIVGQESLHAIFSTTSELEPIDVVLHSFNIPLEVKQTDKGGLISIGFMSKEGLTNQSKVITRGLSGNCGNLIQSILDTELDTDKVITMTPKPVNGITYVPIRQKPFEVIQSILARSVSPESVHHADYLLYETVDGYQLDSINKLITNEIDFTYKLRDAGGTTSPNDFFYIGNFSVSGTPNHLSATNGGLYGTTVGVFDPITRTYTEQKYDYVKNKDDYNYLGNHLFVDESDIQKNSQEGNYKYFLAGTKDSTYLHRNAKFEQLFNGFRLIIDVAGNSDLRVGQIIYIDVPTSNLDTASSKVSKKEKYISGKYLLSSLRHVIALKQDGYRTIVELVKDSYDVPVKPDLDYLPKGTK